MTLKPINLIQAARRDLALRNQKLAARRALPMDLKVSPYAFHRDDVREADDASSLLALALSHPQVGAGSGKHNTRMIYGDEGLMRSALEMVRAQ